MNREIKFRVWSELEQRMLPDIPLLQEAVDKRAAGSVLRLVPRSDDRKMMQFSGLRDSNGTDIYEKDVVYLAGYGNYEVEFPFIELYQAAAEGDIGTILGNVFETPELAEKPLAPATDASGK